MPIVLRPAEASDIGHIASMQFRSENEVEFAGMSLSIKNRILLSIFDLEAVWAERIGEPDFITIVAMDDDNCYVCGVVGVSIHKECGYIRTLYVDPDYLRLGIGGALLSAALRCLVEMGSQLFRLEVLDNNVAAITLYRRFGFKFKPFFFPAELGGTAQALFPNKEYKVRQMQVDLPKLTFPGDIEIKD